MTRKNTFILSMAIMLFAAFSVSAAPASSTEIQKSVEQEVFKKIVTMPYYGLFDSISFEMDGDTVILSGSVYNALNRKVAENRVMKVEGVANVVNNIEILPPSNFDDRIRRRVVRSFANTGGLYRYMIGPNPSMRIIVDGGKLTLTGFVSNEGDIRLATILAKGIPGVFTVTNNLELGNDKKY
ncbi:MAG: BON domain-containing protein [Pyrinomonadaceae bacterium]|nr:BON domain-containing protein [Pyrinomonadaceae bacterium]